MTRHRNDPSLETVSADPIGITDTPARLLEELEIVPEPGST